MIFQHKEKAVLNTTFVFTLKQVACHLFIDEDKLKVFGPKDTWIIKGIVKNQLRLFHNNYKKTSPTERVIVQGYHHQKLEGATLNDMLRFISLYTFEKHLAGEEKQAADTSRGLPVAEGSLEAATELVSGSTARSSADATIQEKDGSTFLYKRVFAFFNGLIKK